jgi:hypothetical protein
MEYMDTIPFDIGTLECSPLFHLDENVFIFFDKGRVEELVTFRQRVRQIS